NPGQYKPGNCSTTLVTNCDFCETDTLSLLLDMYLLYGKANDVNNILEHFKTFTIDSEDRFLAFMASCRPAMYDSNSRYGRGSSCSRGRTCLYSMW
ncbi:hypothetical protein L9F63_002356, partial [Diploptera punctata]